MVSQLLITTRREKVALCWIAFILSCFTIFFVGFSFEYLCPLPEKMPVPANIYGGVVVYGTIYDALSITPPYNFLFENTAEKEGGIDVSLVFPSTSPQTCSDPSVAQYNFAKTINYCDPNCLSINSIPNFNPFKDATQIGGKGSNNLDPTPRYRWRDISNSRRNLVVYHNIVLNFNQYLLLNPIPITGDPVDSFIRLSKTLQDATVAAQRNPNITSQVMSCLIEKYYAGMISQPKPTCMVAMVFTYTVFIMMTGIIVIKITTNYV